MKKILFGLIICLLLIGEVFGETYDFTAKATVEWYITTSISSVIVDTSTIPPKTITTYKTKKITIDTKTFTISDSISVGESKTVKKEVNNIHISLPTGGNIDIDMFTFTTTVSAEQIDENTVKITMTGSISGNLGGNYEVSYSGTVNGEPPDYNSGNTLIWYFTIDNQENNNQEDTTNNQENQDDNQQTTTKAPLPLPAIILTLIAIPLIALRKK